MEGSPVLLVGDAGVGKNALIYYINSLRNLPTIRFSFNEDTLPEDLIGSYRLLMSGNAFEWVNGPIINALQEGIPFVADEMNLASTSVIKRFSTLYESSYIDLLEGGGEKILKNDGFSLIATQNPAEGFEGRKSLPFEITKIRNGKSMKFNVHMDWECLKIVPESSKVIEGKILNKYGNDQKEFAGDLG
jgi:MoxR-like ATPase